MKRMFAIILLSVLSCASAFAYDFSAVCESGQTLFYKIISNNEPYKVVVTCENIMIYNSIQYSYSTYPTGDLIIPSTVINQDITYSVTGIGDGAFYGCENLTSVSISNSINSIGEQAFQGCSGLSSFTIPNSVTSIGVRAFYDCRGLVELYIGESVASIGHFAFGLCSGLTSVVVPNSVTSFGYGIFNGCSGIQHPVYNDTHFIYFPDNYDNVYIIPDGIQYIDDAAFRDCVSLTSIVVPNSVINIGYDAFRDCSGLTDVTLGNSLAYIGQLAFYGCSGLSSVFFTGNIEQWCGIWFYDIYSNPLYQAHNLYVNNELVTDLVIPETVLEIKDLSFFHARCLETIEFGNSITRIGCNAFYGCNGLTGELIIPNSVTNIGEGAFGECNELNSITLGSAVINIGTGAFGYCGSIDTIYSFAINPPTIGMRTFNDVDTNIPIIVPCGSATAYNNAEYWNYFTNIQEDCSGVEENEIAYLQIFPNPVGNILNITSSEEISSVEIVNTLGQVVLQMDVNDESAVCDVENLPSGVYVVNVRTIRQVCFGSAQQAAGVDVAQMKFVKE